MLCILTSERMPAHAFAWLKMIKDIYVFLSIFTTIITAWVPYQRSCLKWASNLGPKRLSLLKFETRRLRPLGHHGRLSLEFVITKFLIHCSISYLCFCHSHFEMKFSRSKLKISCLKFLPSFTAHSLLLNIYHLAFILSSLLMNRS